jgi:N-acetylglutamate synthase
MPMSVQLRGFKPSDHPAVLVLWRATPGIVVRDADGYEAVAAYLERNPGMSFVAVSDGAVVGAILCGTDGRRGYLQHLAVLPSHRGRGIGRRLAECAIAALAGAGIDKCHLMVVSGNQSATAFWRHLGWLPRTDIEVMSYTQSGVATA